MTRGGTAPAPGAPVMAGLRPAPAGPPHVICLHAAPACAGCRGPESNQGIPVASRHPLSGLPDCQEEEDRRRMQSCYFLQKRVTNVVASPPACVKGGRKKAGKMIMDHPPGTERRHLPAAGPDGRPVSDGRSQATGTWPPVTPCPWWQSSPRPWRPWRRASPHRRRPRSRPRRS